MTNQSKASFKLPVLLSIIGLIGTGIGASISGYFNIQLEKEKLRSSLILKAVETNDPKDALDFLKFLEQTNLVDDIETTIEAWEENPEVIPLRPTKKLEEGIFNTARSTRRKSLQQMIEEDSENIEVIKAVLSSIEEHKFVLLSPEAKVNALFFLNKTNFKIWTNEMKEEGINTVKALYRLELGPQARNELNKLESTLNMN